MSCPAAWIHIELVPMWSHIKSLRHFVRDFCLGVGLPGVTADQVAMTTSELLENATKYAAAPHLRYKLRICDGHVEVSVANQASSRQRRTLRWFLEEVTRGDPLDAYLRCLERQGDSGVSQSGLARIRYEAGATLSATEQGDEVTVLARLPR
ncbi:MAG: hypothetical protein RMK29_09130 [Myxococcales bacterium]|nr:hypothetical protein [Myxococcota bacterium]MDW8281861.1 hypothetical protein [Myxococcales bacterium]